MYFHKLDSVRKLVYIQNSIVQTYGTNVTPIKVDDVNIQEIEELLRIIMNRHAFQALLDTYMSQGWLYGSILIAEERIRTVVEKGLFPKYFGIDHFPGSPFILGEIVHAVSLVLEEFDENLLGTSQMSPAIFLHDYAMASDFLPRQSRMLVAGAFSPLSVVDWIQIKELFFPNSSIVFIDLVGGLKAKFADLYGVNFVQGNVLNAQMGVSVSSIFTNSLTQSLQKLDKYEEYESMWNYASLESQLEVRRLLFDKFSRFLATGGSLVMIERDVEVGSVSDIDLLASQLMAANFYPKLIQPAKELRNRYWAEFCLKNSVIADTEDVEGMYLIIAEKL